jgi:Ni,Fe-hydrogenase III component G
MIDKLPEIKKILNKFPQVLIDIKEFSVDCIEYKVENKRLCYVLEYLHYY